MITLHENCPNRPEKLRIWTLFTQCKVIGANPSVSVNSLYPKVIALSTGEKLRMYKVDYVSR